MKMQKKHLSTAIALALMLTIAATFMTALPDADAQITWPTKAYVACSPNPIGVGQSVWVGAWLTPSTPSSGSTQWHYENLTITIQKPDGTLFVQNINTPYAESSGWFYYVPQTTGTYLVWSSVPEQVIRDDTYTAATSRKIELIVQEEQIPEWQETPLPTGFWDRPISPDNREWYSIAGDWWMRNYASSGSNFNPWTLGPESAHVLWKLPIQQGGIIGGDYYPLGYYGRSNPAVNPITTILNGKAYHGLTTPSGSGIHCIDVHTGEELWVREGSFTFGAIEYNAESAVLGISYNSILVTVGSSLTKYDAFTGALMFNGSGMSGTVDWPYVYSFSGSGANRRLINWDATVTSNDFSSRIVYNVSAHESVGISKIDGDIGVSITNNPSQSGAYDLTTGALLWNRTMPEAERSESSGSGPAADGRIYIPGYGATAHCYDMRTGNKLWTSDEALWPWGTFVSYQHAAAYGNFYKFTYGGIVCYEGTTGKVLWTFATPSSGFETPFNGYAFWTSGIVADGKVYGATSEHSITIPAPRGQRLWCVNATTGELIWSMQGSLTTRGGSIGDSVLVTGDELMGFEYGFAKGKTTTTATASPSVMANGTSVLIQGTVTDQSPAQPNTAAISDEYMSEWMAYLHMQQPMPTNATGVEVLIDVIDENNNTRPIGTTTSDMSGFYSFDWQPDIPGKYTVIATFAGSKSYYASYSETAFTVMEAPDATPEPTPMPAPMTDVYVTGFGAGMIIAIAVVGLLLVLMLRKR